LADIVGMTSHPVANLVSGCPATGPRICWNIAFYHIGAASATSWRKKTCSRI
jgi:hypothetical protein